MRASPQLRLAVLRKRASGVRQHQIARAAEMHPTILSSILSGGLPITDRDPRVLRLAMVLGLSPDDCVAPDRAD